MSDSKKDVEVRKDQPSVQLDQAQQKQRFLERFYDPAFDRVKSEIDRIAEVAWESYDVYRKSPRTRRAGSEFANPDYELAVEWLDARDAIRSAQAAHDDRSSPTRILVVCGAARSNQTCPGESSKTYRLCQIAKETLEKESQLEVDLLDLSHLTSEYGRVIYPCKACVSTAMPLCNWPCSCYPNHALGQVNDWMNEIYPRWVRAHGVMIVTPVYWYQAPTVLKSMIDRLVCADGGNPDPTRTNGKDPAKAKELELEGWDFPRHLAGRAFTVVVHGDADGVENLRRALSDWLTDMQLVAADPVTGLGRYIGYYESYARSHEALDQDEAFQSEVRIQAQSLARKVSDLRAGKYARSDSELGDPRPK